MGTQHVAFDGPNQTRIVQFDATPAKPGFQRLSVTADRPAGVPPQRLIVGQPRASKLVHVVGRYLRVLYIEGRQRYENKFIAQALSGAGRFWVDRRILTGGPEDQAFRRQPGKELWAGYHVVMLGDCPASAFSAEQLEELRRVVEQDGKGLAMIGGRESFAGGGWAATPLALVLPVDVAASVGQCPGPIRVLPTADGLASEVMRIGADGKTAEAWASLRPLAGANRLAGPKPAATVLALGGRRPADRDAELRRRPVDGRGVRHELAVGALAG